jgi:hypothetical protein
MRSVLFATLVAISACTPKDKTSGHSTDPAKCTTVGQTCEYSPGKLGTCVARDDCTSDCFVCQSQH